VEYTGTVKGVETWGGSSGSGELSPPRGSVEMINDCCSDANRKVLIERIAEYPLPTAQA